MLSLFGLELAMMSLVTNSLKLSPARAAAAFACLCASLETWISFVSMRQLQLVASKPSIKFTKINKYNANVQYLFDRFAKPAIDQNDMIKDTIEETIMSHCRGKKYLEFKSTDLSKMVEEIRAVIARDVKENADNYAGAISVIEDKHENPFPGYKEPEDPGEGTPFLFEELDRDQPVTRQEASKFFSDLAEQIANSLTK